ncbi:MULTISPECIES: LacI family DNA-binding transcriptional regulator [Actinomadura]|uniref:Transcriptional regulator, LacI family n=1 Tax=Actinomadura madurae TaxID=1993 RepID=A0A1I5F846_9ACTN|nr:LacI family DNA-binding transcriptional regulator [Actinomadura madurae]SFO19904.1 transcriptional regulator, LacI family [Actinomadura madurae]SPT60264.1 Degradation activator [Actinomadura madurae]
MDTPQDTSAAGPAGASRGAGPGRPTIKDVAAAAGVSTATVSRVLSGTSPVSPDLVARVTRVIDELGYSPNGLTRGVFKGRSNSIGVLVGDLRNHFYVELVRGAEEVATSADGSVLLADTSRNPSAERRLLSLMDEQRVRGLITTTGHDNDDLTRQMASRGAQCVLLTRAPAAAHPRMHSVHLDDRAAGALCARHLYGLGRRRIAVVTSTRRLTTQRLRLAGVAAERDATGPPAGPISVHTCETQEPGVVAEAVAELLTAREGGPPDAVICTSGRLTREVFGSLRAAGARIPDDIAFVSFDDFPWASLIDPPLTVVDQHPHRMGVLATRLILAEDRDEPEEIVIEPTLIVRRSCGGA